MFFENAQKTYVKIYFENCFFSIILIKFCSDWKPLLLLNELSTLWPSVKVNG